MDERRRYERKPTSIRVEMSNPNFGTIIGFARDISDGGASVVIDGHIIPPIGTEVNVRFRKIIGPINAEPVKMTLMHQDRNTIGLMFS